MYREKQSFGPQKKEKKKNTTLCPQLISDISCQVEGYFLCLDLKVDG